MTCYVNICLLVAGNFLSNIIFIHQHILYYIQLFPRCIGADLNIVNCFSVPAPRRLRFKVLSSSKLLVSWKEPKGDFDSYLFLYNSIPGRIIFLYTHTDTHTHTLAENTTNNMWDLTLKFWGKDPIMTWIFCLSGKIM